MGRYYNGDINGKFYFAVQSSDDASFFGGFRDEPRVIEYCFNMDDDFDSVMEGIFKCYGELGEYKQKLDNFFKENDSYNYMTLKNYLDISIEKIEELLMWYARLEMGTKIWGVLKERDFCEFQVEY